MSEKTKSKNLSLIMMTNRRKHAIFVQSNTTLMNRYLLLLIGLLTFTMADAQLDKRVLTHGGKTRTYFMHVPANYNASKPASIVIWLHGLGAFNIDDMQNFYEPNQFILVADTANFILLAPVAEDSGLLGMRAWNSLAGIGLLGLSLNTDKDDFGFIDAMLDKTIDQYAVDTDKIFVCGFSMGGFMTNRLALEHNERFAAFASVSGTIGANITAKNPGKPIRLAHFHGTVDQTVGYFNNTFGMAVEPMMDFWIANNNCDKNPASTSEYTDRDGFNNKAIQVNHFVYSNGGADIELFRQINADHVWLEGNSRKIWEFFLQTGKSTVATKDLNSLPQFEIFPNPVSDHVTIRTHASNKPYQISIQDIQGRSLFNTTTSDPLIQILRSDILAKSGVYFVRIWNEDINSTQKLILN